MVNKFYDPGQARAAKVKELFGKIAPRYDLINDLQSAGLHRAWKRRLIRLAAPRRGELALDVCCGTGDLVRALSESMDAVGLDFSEPMLARARDRVTAPLVRGDTEWLPFPDAKFDLVTVGYGLRNLASWEKGIEEMWRVAKPGGRLLVLDFGKPDNEVWRSVYFSYLRVVVPIFGRVFCGDAQAYSYILESLKHYPAQRGVAGKFEALGCAQVQSFNLLGGAMAINYALK